MIEYTYQVERNEEDETKTYVPNVIPTRIPNLVYIEGPNSIGKSTLLNIIALGLHGQKNKGIPQALGQKMRSLLDTSYQTLKFDIKITKNDAGFELVSTKTDPKLGDITVYEYKDGKKTILTPDRIQRKYNIIYDIPNNPTERINQLAFSIKEIQVIYGNRIGQLKDYILKVINEIKDSRDPKRLEKLKEKLQLTKTQHEKLTEEIDIERRNLDLLQKYTYSRFYAEYLDRLVHYQDKLEKLKGKKQTISKKTAEHDKIFSKKRRKLEETINLMKADYRQVTTLLKMLLSKKDRYHLEVWERISLDDVLRDLEFDDTFFWEINTLKSDFSKILNEQKHEESLLEAKLYRDLISFLTQYEKTQIIIPGLEKPIEDFIRIIRKANEKNETLLHYDTNVEKLIEILQRLDINCQKCMKKIFPNVKTLKYEDKRISDEIDGTERIDEQIKEIKKASDATEKRTLLYQGECARRGVVVENLQEVLDEFEKMDSITPYFIYDERQLRNKISEMEQNLSAIEDKFKNQEFWIIQYKKDIEKLEKMELHKYHDRVDSLNSLFNRTQKIQQQFLNQYALFINDIIDKKPISKNNTNPIQLKYLEEVSKYLGKRVGTIRHINDMYDVKEINLLDGIVKTTQGKIIRLSDFGTGQSQSAYLLGKLNTEDERPLIALFDEVAMMDDYSLELVFQKLRELYHDNRLVAAIVVQKANQFTMKSILESD